ncbi:hypothetical protein Cni_G06432 [Canna indica]|uniref:Bifunctional inhibitor/plant lipid transfer protein/seed storage helical domain-containing protein n=1 Tax=Canna indica TaxID=4628 RepID=A0AAQ3JYP6_9LILI|nr:hypothetical protein Cni_G06432 [Canna indica]
MVISAETPPRPQDPAPRSTAPPTTATEAASPRREPQASLLQNLSFPLSKTWGSHRVLRCMSVNDKGEIIAGGGRRSVASVPEALGTRITVPESGDADGDDDPGIEEVREKLLVHLREAADRMKLVPVPEVPGLTNRGIVEPKAAVPPKPVPAPEEMPEHGTDASAEPEPPRWNVRTRRRAPRAPMGIERHLNDSPAVATEKRTVRLRSEDSERRERAKFSISLTRDEIDEDIYAVTGCRARRRPKKRPRAVQKQLDSLFPGMWLSDITVDTYRKYNSSTASRERSSSLTENGEVVSTMSYLGNSIDAPLQLDVERRGAHELKLHSASCRAWPSYWSASALFPISTLDLTQNPNPHPSFSMHPLPHQGLLLPCSIWCVSLPLSFLLKLFPLCAEDEDEEEEKRRRSSIARMSTNFAAAAMEAVVPALTGSATQTLPSRASNLVDRAMFINSTETPPQSCCVPLKEATKNDLPCLYGLFNNTAILKAINVNIMQSIQMAKLCRVSPDQSACQIAVVVPTINCNHSKLQAQLLLHRGGTSGFGARLLHRGSNARLLHPGGNDEHSDESGLRRACGRARQLHRRPLQVREAGELRRRDDRCP